ncbi:MAG: lytic transglycosylase [Rickettsiales bacterium]|nr:lytic transglycosylase [Rickettsiales bacterium]
MTIFSRICAVIMIAFCSVAHAEEPHNAMPFGLWVKEFKMQALGQGISPQLLEEAFDGLEPNNRVVALDRKQPEGTKTFTEYMRGAVSQTRIDKGRKLYDQHKPLLDEIAAKYGVQPRFIVALWGIETNYGGYTGNFSIIEALATLAYDGRRSDFFRKELLNALTILQEGHITLDEMEGSWAGAMGQCQFMPSSFIAYAVDYNGDGRRDIWNSLPDIFASIANYLSQSGWNDDETWGRQVSTLANANIGQSGLDVMRPLAEWQQRGVRSADGTNLPQADLQAALVYPGTEEENAYLVYGNYKVLLKWNRSKYFATAVGTLSNRIARM